MAQHIVKYTEIPGPTGEPVYIKTTCNLCGTLGTFKTEDDADHDAHKHIHYYHANPTR